VAVREEARGGKRVSLRVWFRIADRPEIKPDSSNDLIPAHCPTRCNQQAEHGYRDQRQRSRLRCRSYRRPINLELIGNSRGIPIHAVVTT
jgi:hypothetical protein